MTTKATTHPLAALGTLLLVGGVVLPALWYIILSLQHWQSCDSTGTFSCIWKESALYVPLRQLFVPVVLSSSLLVAAGIIIIWKASRHAKNQSRPQ